MQGKTIESILVTMVLVIIGEDWDRKRPATDIAEDVQRGLAPEWSRARAFHDAPKAQSTPSYSLFV